MTAQTAANLKARAAAIANAFAGSSVSSSQVGGLLTDMVDSAGLAVSISASPAANTLAIQAAIDAAHAAYLAGAGITDVVLPEMDPLPLGPSTSSETFWNYHVQVPASAGCIAMRSGVRLRGAGIGNTVLTPSSPTLDCIYWVDGSDSVISDIEINGGWAGSGAGHAILQVSSADAPMTVVKDLLLRDVYCHDVGSYGLGLENGEFANCRVQGFHSKNTGADGIDIKSRPGTTNDSKGIILDDIYVDAPGLRLDTQTGVDIRGNCLASNITVVNVGRLGATVTGIRFRVYSVDEGGADDSALTNFYVRAASGSFDVYGVDCGADFVKVGNGQTFSCKTGVWAGGNYGSFSNIIAKSSTTRGFMAAPGYSHNRIADCTAYSCTVGFDDQGTYTTITGCDGLTCTTPLSTAGGGTLRTQQLAGNQLYDAHGVLVSGAANRADWSARGSGTDIDLYAEPKGAGILKIASISFLLGGNVKVTRGTGSPNSVLIGSVGDMYLRTDGGAATTLYIKESGAATNTGWVAK